MSSYNTRLHVDVETGHGAARERDALQDVLKRMEMDKLPPMLLSVFRCSL